ncbi:MAG: ribosome recycling factor [Gammaproteobacteria bacterium]
MLATITQESQQRMQKAVEALKNELSKLRSGRAHPSLIEHILVDYYGTPTPLNRVANVSTEDARTLQVSPWEKNMVKPIEKAIMTADLGLNPATSGTLIRVPLPPLTEERRKELVKLARHEAENTRVSIRNIRRDANNQVKELLKDKTISEDEERRGQDAIQKLTDKLITEVDTLVAAKEKDLLEV